MALIRPPADSEATEVRAYVAQAEALAKGEGVRTVTYRAPLRGIRKGTFLKQKPFLGPRDAYRLYAQLHYSPVLVCAFLGAYVSKEPVRDEVKETLAIPLVDFVRYKACHRIVRGAADIEVAFDALAAWSATVACDGANDPRALPLHVFASRCDSANLATDQGRRAFRSHGPAGRRTDANKLTWARATALHGGVAPTVAGCRLEAGTHWDVSTSRGKAKVHNSQEIWCVAGDRRSYVNVFPDAKFLVSKASTAKKIWPKK